MSKAQTTSVSRRDRLAADIRSELRGILRQLDDLRQPLSRFERLPHPKDGQPEYYVHFDDRPRRQITGLRFRSNNVALPDERIGNMFLSAAEALWHLKDRIHQWCKLTCVQSNVEAHAKQSPELLVCADLANWKKHGRHGNRSGKEPRLGLVEFDTSQSGIIELFYEGATKEKELLVSDPTPLPFAASVLSRGQESEIGDAMAILLAALDHWKPLIVKVGLLDEDDRESSALRKMMGCEVHG